MNESDNKPQDGCTVDDTKNRANTSFPSVIEFLVVLAIVLILVATAVPALPNGIQKNRESASAAAAHNLAIAAFGYSNDNNQTYPNGSSSTAIFQTLYDGKYLQQPGEVYLKPNHSEGFYPRRILYSQSGQYIHLKPENVCWDFNTQDSTGLKGTDPNDLPLLFSEVDTAPAWKAGVNNATITWSDTWGTDGVTMCTLDQQGSFVRRSAVAGTVPLTKSDFTPAPDVTYVTRKP